jgi:hypothetical protein
VTWVKLAFQAEGDRFERQERFAGLVHWLDGWRCIQAGRRSSLQ